MDIATYIWQLTFDPIKVNFKHREEMTIFHTLLKRMQSENAAP